MELKDLTTPRDKDGFILLERTYSDLHKKAYYTTSIPLIQNRIYEYDIRSANVTMLAKSGKVKPETIKDLAAMDKADRERTVGKMIRRDKKIYKIIANGIAEARENLFRANQIQDHEVLSIKNDAVFIIGRKLKRTKFGQVEFRVKGQYTIFHQINRIEFYYDKRHKRVDIKGVADQVLEHPDHQSGMMEFLRKVYDYLDYDRRDSLREYLISFSRDYKAKKLPHQYYRELSSENIYRTIVALSGFEYNMTEAWDSDLDIINPVYNYKRFILPMIQQFL